VFVIVKSPDGFEPHPVRLGVSNFDYAQVLSGVAEGDSVALLGAAEAQAERSGFADRIRQRMGAGLPGSGGGSRGTGGGSGGSRGGR
jgi:hypothetical protein